MPDRAAITGVGLLSALGRNLAETSAALQADRGGIGPVSRCDARAFSSQVAGEVRWSPTGDLCIGFAVEAAWQAWAAAGLPRGLKVPVIAGTSAGPHSYEDAHDALSATDPPAAARQKAAAHHRAIAEAVALHLDLRGPRFAPATACASGNVALALALDLVRMGWPVVLTGGSEALGWRRMAGFHALGALSEGPCAPFSHPYGMSLGEGAAFFVVESETHARARGAQLHGWIRGHGLSADAWHPTAPDPRGQGMVRALRAALLDAGLQPGEVDGYAAHGTGTESNDAAEWAALTALFGEQVPPVFAAKSALGHSFGASGPQAAALGLLGMAQGRWPATHGWAGPRPDGPDAPPVVIPGRHPPGRTQTLLSLNAAFGGANAAVVLEAGDGVPLAEASGAPPARARVALSGAGLAGAEDPLAAFRRILPRVDPRGLDRPALLLSLAVGRALAQAPRVEDRDRFGLLSGVSRRPTESGERFRASLRTAQGTRGSAAAFAHGVMNASTGAAALALGLRGPGATLANGHGAGLFALAWAWWLLTTRPTIEGLVVGAVDELPLDPTPMDPEQPGIPATGPCSAEGAAAVVLGRAGSLWIEGVGFSGPETPIEATLAASGGGPVDRLIGSASGPRAAAVESELAKTLDCPWQPWTAAGHAEASAALSQVARLVETPLPGRTAVFSWCPHVGAVAVVLGGDVS